MYEFKLYLVGQTPKSITLVGEMKKLLAEAFDGHYNLEVIDIIEKPQLAEKDKIIATPTLEEISPEPVKRVVGYLSDKERVGLALGLIPRQENVIK